MLTLCIQAGGKSSRMGKDKGLLDFGGQPLIQHILARLDCVAQESIVTTNHPEDYKFLKLPLVADVIPDRGALGGLLTALQAAGQPLVAVVACDMPFASPEIVRACRDILVSDNVLDVVIPRSKHGLEPLHAVYRRETCLPAVKAAIEAGRWKMISWHADVNLRVIPYEEVAKLDPGGTAFENINTPEEFEMAIQRINQAEG